MSIHVVSHPLVQAKLSELRDKRTSSHRFRALVKELTTILGIEATRDVQLQDVPGVRPPSRALRYLSSVISEDGSHCQRCRASRRSEKPTKDLSLTARVHLQLESPIAPYTGKAVAPRIGLSPILRAGIGMTDRAWIQTVV